MKFTRLFCAVGISSLAAFVSAADVPNAAKFDTAPKDGYLNDQERTRYYAHKDNLGIKDIAKIAKTNGLSPTPAEWQGWLKTRDEDLMAFHSGQFSPQGVSVRFLDKHFEAPPVSATPDESAEEGAGTKDEESPWSKFRVRRKAEDLQVASSDGGYSDLDPATLTFAYNGLTDDDAWATHLAVAYPFTLAEKVRVGRYAEIARVELMPSIALDRVDGLIPGLEDKEADNLAYRIGLNVELQGFFGLDYQILTASGKYVTNSDGDSKSYGGELDWRPVLLAPISINGGRQGVFGKDSLLLYQMTFVLHGEAGRDEETSTDFARIRSAVGINFGFKHTAPDWLRRQSLHATYTYLWGLSGEPDDADLFTAAWRMNLDDEDHLYIEAAYDKGESMEDFAEIDLFRVSLGAKF